MVDEKTHDSTLFNIGSWLEDRLVLFDLLCRIARQHRLNHVIFVESEEADCCDFGIPPLHPRIGFEC